MSSQSHRVTLALLCLAWLTATSPTSAQVSFERLRNAEKEPHNWLTYSGNYASHRFSSLTQIDRSNVANLRTIWAYQVPSGYIETTPLVVDGIMYLTEPPSSVSALDVRTGRRLWRWDAEIGPNVLNIGFP